MKHDSITAARIDGGNVRLASLHDSIMIERADLDDAIRALCDLRFVQDPVGYLEFAESLIPASAPLGPPTLTYRDIAEKLSGTVSAEGRMVINVLDDEDIEGITGRKP